MRAVIEIIAKSLVEHPDEVQIREMQSGNETTYELSVAREDMGRVIGRQGRIAKAMRTMLKAAATKQKRYVNLEIIDPSGGQGDIQQ